MPFLLPLVLTLVPAWAQDPATPSAPPAVSSAQGTVASPAAAPTANLTLPAWPSRVFVAPLLDLTQITDKTFSSALLTLEVGEDGDGLYEAPAAGATIPSVSLRRQLSLPNGAKAFTRGDILAALDDEQLVLGPVAGERKLKLTLTGTTAADSIAVDATVTTTLGPAEPKHIRRAGPVDLQTELPLDTHTVPAPNLKFSVDGTEAASWVAATTAFYAKMAAPKHGEAPVSRSLTVTDGNQIWTVARLVVHAEVEVPDSGCFTSWISTRHHKRPITPGERAGRIVRYDEHVDRLRLEMGVGQDKKAAVSACLTQPTQVRMVVALRPFTGDVAKDALIPHVSTPWTTTQPASDADGKAPTKALVAATAGAPATKATTQRGTGNRIGLPMRATWEQLKAEEDARTGAEKWSGGAIKAMDGKTNGAFSYYVKIEVNDDPENLDPIVVATKEHVLRIDLDETVSVAAVHDVVQTGVLMLGCRDIDTTGDSPDAKACADDPNKTVLGIVESTSPLGVRLSIDPFYYQDAFGLSAQLNGPAVGATQSLSGASSVDSTLGFSSWGSLTVGAELRATDNSFARLGLGMALVQGEDGTVLRPFAGLAFTITSADSKSDTTTEDTGTTNSADPVTATGTTDSALATTTPTAASKP